MCMTSWTISSNCMRKCALFLKDYLNELWMRYLGSLPMKLLNALAKSRSLGLVVCWPWVDFYYYLVSETVNEGKGCYGINVHPKIPRVLRARDGRRENSRGPVHATDYKCIFTFGSGPKLQRLISKHAEGIVGRKESHCCTISMFQTKQLEIRGS